MVYICTSRKPLKNLLYSIAKDIFSPVNIHIAKICIHEILEKMDILCENKRKKRKRKEKKKINNNNYRQTY